MLDELSIIIPTLNEEKYLPKILDSLLEQTFPGKLQIIVVDGKSNDKTSAIAKQYEKKFKNFVFLESSRGLSIQRNIGAKYALYDHLIFADADIVFPKTFLVELVKKMEPNENFIASIMLWSTERNLLDQLVLFSVIPLIWVSSIFDPLIGAGFIFTTKKNHEKIGEFNEDIVFAEDFEYGKRSLQHGAQYHFFFFPFALSSPRRARKMGRIHLILYWIKGYIYTRKHGYITKESGFKYPFGHYE